MRAGVNRLPPLPPWSVWSAMTDDVLRTPTPVSLASITRKGLTLMVPNPASVVCRLV